MKQNLLKTFMIMFLLGGVFVMTMAQTAYGLVKTGDFYRTAQVDVSAINSTNTTPLTLGNTDFNFGEYAEVCPGVSAENKYYTYVIDENNKVILYSVNFTTETAKPIDAGTLGLEVVALTYVSSSKKFYVMAKNSDTGNTDVYELDVTTGKRTQVAILTGTYNNIIADKDGNGFIGIKAERNSYKYYPSIYRISNDFANTELIFKDEVNTVSGMASHPYLAYDTNGVLYYFANTSVYTINFDTKTVTLNGKTDSSLLGVTFTKSTEDGATTQTGGEEEKKPKRVLIRETQFGDSQNTAPDDVAMKRTNYFYDTNNKLIRVTKTGRLYSGDTGVTDNWDLTEYQKYVYDANGNLESHKLYKNGLNSYGDMESKEQAAGKETYEYNDKNQLVKKITSTYIYEYEYDTNGNKVKETKKIASSGKATQEIVYIYDENNKLEMTMSTNPSSPNSTSTSTVYNGIFVYDDNGNKIQEVHVSPKDLSITYSIDEWTYDATGFMTTYTSYKVSNGEPVPSKQTTYEMVDNNPNRIKVISYSWQKDENLTEGGKWTRFGLPVEQEYVEFTDEIAEYVGTELSVTKATDSKNTAVLSFRMPMMITSPNPAKIEIYRNGTVIASKDAMEVMTTMIPENPEIDETTGLPILKYEDKELKNGDYEYYLQVLIGQSDTPDELAEPTYTYTGYNTSNVASVTMDLLLPCVTNVTATSKIKDTAHDEDVVTVSWSNPEGMEEYGFISNILFLDNKYSQSATDTTLNVSDTELAFNTYKTTQNVFILTKYKYGNAKSEVITIDITTVPTDINTIIGTGMEVKLNGRTLSLSREAAVAVYSISGKLAAKAYGSSISLDALTSGTYIICVEHDGKTDACKVVLK